MTCRSLCRYSATLRHAEVVIQKEEEEYQTEEDEGRADERERERERVPTLIEYMEEDEDVVLVDNVIDDYDEERDLVPMKWRHIGFDEYIL
jgi:transcriptional/translational regulatory protein YebC/TACO1